MSGKIKMNSMFLKLLGVNQLGAKGYPVSHQFPGGLDLEAQLKLAATYCLCPRIVKTGDQFRICGGPMGKSRSTRNCEKCPREFKRFKGSLASVAKYLPKLQITTEIVVDIPPHQDAMVTDHDQAITKLEAELHHREQLLVETKALLEKANLRIAELEEQVAKNPTVLMIIDAVWTPGNSSKTTIRASKTCARRIVRVLGISLDADATKMLAKVRENPDKLFRTLVDKEKDSKNTLCKLGKILLHTGAADLYQRVKDFVHKEFPARAISEKQRLSKKETDLILQCAGILGVDLSQARPGERLLGAMRERTVQFGTNCPETRRWKTDQLFQWFLPAIRGGTSHFKIVGKMPPKKEWKSCNENLAVWDLGRLKKTTKQFAHLWKKRCALTEAGMVTTGKIAATVPIHMRENWAAWWEMLTATVVAEMMYRESGPSTFSPSFR